MDEDLTPESFPDTLASLTASFDLPGYMADLAYLEWMLYHKEAHAGDPFPQVRRITINPTLTIVPVHWKNLAAFIRSNATGAAPQRQPAHVIVWRHPEAGDIHFREAGDIDLLALKLILEKIDVKEAAAIGGVTRRDIQTAIDRAISHGFLLSPGCCIRREPPPVGKIDPSLDAFLSTDVFTLQWHVTQACDLHCRHCYDRSDRTPMALNTAMVILDDFYDFCQRMQVKTVTAYWMRCMGKTITNPFVKL